MTEKKAEAPNQDAVDAIVKSSHSDMCDSVVLNAIDFMSQSAKELERNPKFSVINFCTALELFLKARLMKEHWSLVLQDPGEANIRTFTTTGDFITVGMGKLLTRLEKIIGHDLGAAKGPFKEIYKHRNRVAHFYNEKYESPETETVAEIVAEQCTAWLHLYGLLTKTWKDCFEDHKWQITQLDSLMCKNRSFLKKKFDAVKDEIEVARQKGSVYVECRSCGCESSEQTKLHEGLFRYRCAVCHHRPTVLQATCPECKVPVELVNEGYGTCDECGTEFEPEEIKTQFDKEEYPFLNDGEFYDPEIYCHCCEHVPASVVKLTDSLYLCLSCFETHEGFVHCEYCYGQITGSSEMTFFLGCVACDGQRMRD